MSTASGLKNSAMAAPPYGDCLEAVLRGEPECE
jgi:hypothetical protein